MHTLLSPNTSENSCACNEWSRKQRCKDTGNHILLKTALYSHTMQSNHLTCMLQWLLAWSQNCATITKIYFRLCSSPQKNPPYSLPQIPQLQVYIYLNEFVYSKHFIYVVFCIWLLQSIFQGSPRCGLH